jgi:uncharacterized repeat protein (TIGR02543 family)
MKIKYLLCMLLTLLICASCYNPWITEILGLKTITFDSNGGSHVSSQDLIKGKKVTRPANPSRIGFTFEAWYIDNGTFEEEWNFNIVPTFGFTLYAKWNPEKGTEGLKYELINGNTAYRVSRGTATGAIHIPVYYPNADGLPLPVTEIGNGTNEINNNAFGGTDQVPNDTVTGVTFAAGNKLTAISSFAFFNSPSLTVITIPASVTSIDNRALANCTNLARITISLGIKSIGDGVFWNCTSLTSITIPASVTSVGSHAFVNWTAAQTIYIRGHASEAAADAAWGYDEVDGSGWRMSCSAVIKYWNGSSYQ